MDPQPPARRHYGDKEIGKILRRASELQRAEPARPDPAGLSLAELEEVALEAGIDAVNLRRAAAELDAGAAAGWGDKYLGAPLAVCFEGTVAGELDVDELGAIVPMIQSAAGSPGQASVVGRTLTWHSPPTQAGRNLQVLIMSKNGETLIRVEERHSQSAIGLHVGIPSGGIGLGLPLAIGIGAADGVAIGLGVGIAAVAGSYWLARAIYRRMSGKRRKGLSRLFDQIVEQVESAAHEPALASGETTALSAPEA